MREAASRPARASQPREDQLRKHRFVLQRAFEEGRKEYGELSLSFDQFARRCLSLTCRRLLASGVQATPSRIAATLCRAAVSDTYLTVACDEGCAGAWETFTQRFIPRLRRLGIQQGASETDAEEVAREVPSELATPPADGETKTKLGRFDGAASLFSWLAVIMLRRLVDRGRAAAVRAVPTNLESRELPEPRAEEPSAAMDGEENARGLREALKRGWRDLTRQESLALLWKYRDGLPQKRIAVLLGVGPARVSRILKRAVEKIRASTPRHLFEPSDGHWLALRGVVEEYMATLSPSDEPPDGRAVR